jgi:hypothetical protein
MRLSIDFSHGELRQLLDDITPFRFHLGQEQWLEFTSPSHSEMLPGFGLRVTAKGRVRLSALTVPVILDVRKTTVVFEPVVIGDAGSQRLAFAVNVERLDFERIPAFLEAIAERKLSKMLSANETALVFDFASLMSRDIGITPKIVPLQQLRLQTLAGAVEVQENGVRFDVQLNSRIVASAPKRPGLGPDAGRTDANGPVAPEAEAVTAVSQTRKPPTVDPRAEASAPAGVPAPGVPAPGVPAAGVPAAGVPAPGALAVSGPDEIGILHEV